MNREHATNDMQRLSSEGRHRRTEQLRQRLTELSAAAHRGEASWRDVEAARRALSAAVAAEAEPSKGELSARLYGPFPDARED